MAEYNTIKGQARIFNQFWNRFNPQKAMTTGPERLNPASVLVNLNGVVTQPVLGELNQVIERLDQSAPGHRPEKEHHLTMRAIADLTPPFNEDQLREWSERAEQIIHKFKPIEVTVRGLSTFPNVAFARVYVPPEFWQLHNELLDALPSRNRDREGPGMVPHLALMYYTHPPGDLLPHLAKLKNHHFGNFTVNQYNLEGRSIGKDNNQHHHFSTINM